MNTKIKPLWRENLIHMLGCGSHIPKRNHGYRNHYCASTIGSNDDYQSMVEMQKAGLVKAGRRTTDMQFFYATETGCKAIGLSAAVIKRALEA
jgi:hypothetical protein